MQPIYQSWNGKKQKSSSTWFSQNLENRKNSLSSMSNDSISQCHINCHRSSWMFEYCLFQDLWYQGHARVYLDILAKVAERSICWSTTETMRKRCWNARVIACLPWQMLPTASASLRSPYSTETVPESIVRRSRVPQAFFSRCTSLLVSLSTSALMMMSSEHQPEYIINLLCLVWTLAFPVLTRYNMTPGKRRLT